MRNWRLVADCNNISIVRNEIWPTEVKITVCKSMGLTTLLYGLENWVCQEKHDRKLNMVGIQYLKRVWMK